MSRPLTAKDRTPQPGDTLRTHYDGIIEIRGDCGHAALILSKRGREKKADPAHRVERRMHG